MHTKPGFNLRTVCGVNVIVAQGRENIDFNNIINLNETAAFLWNSVAGKEFTIEDLVGNLLAEYEVDEATALADCTALAKEWIEVGIVAE